MEEPAGEPRERDTKAKWSEATGQAILLAGIGWSLFSLAQARWYMPAFNAYPYGARWFAVTFFTGAVPTLAVLFLAFLASWLLGALRGRSDPWRSWRDGVLLATLFTLLVNLGMWLGLGH
ncbi:MAG TPA: hypothetical protein VF718_12470 [Allosphingosinicella sp.]|jgi:hypothetical protein